MTTDTSPMEQAVAEAARRFEEAAEAYRESLDEQWNEVLPGNHSPSQSVLLAHMITMHDGYHAVEFCGEWERRKKTGWQSSVTFLADVEPRSIVDFGIEVRYEDCVRQLAVIIDDVQPGERTAWKRSKETRLIALGFRVLVFSESEILNSPESCRERVESVIFNLNDEVLAEAGVIRGPINA